MFSCHFNIQHAYIGFINRLEFQKHFKNSSLSVKPFWCFYHMTNSDGVIVITTIHLRLKYSLYYTPSTVSNLQSIICNYSNIDMVLNTASLMNKKAKCQHRKMKNEKRTSFISGYCIIIPLHLKLNTFCLNCHSNAWNSISTNLVVIFEKIVFFFFFFFIFQYFSPTLQLE